MDKKSLCSIIFTQLIIFVVLFMAEARGQSGNLYFQSRESQLLVSKQELNQVEKAGTYFVNRFHKTLDFELLYSEMFTSNVLSRVRKGDLLLGLITKELLTEIDDSTLKRLYIAYWNTYYLSVTYMFSQAPEISLGEYNMLLPELNMQVKKSKFGTAILLEAENDSPSISTATDLDEFIRELTKVASIYKKHIPLNYFSSKVYPARLKTAGLGILGSPKLMEKPETLGFATGRRVYRLDREIFHFFFILERGAMKIVEMGLSD